MANASHVTQASVSVGGDNIRTETAHHPHSFFSPFLSPTRMTLYVGKDEAGFYVSKALVHTGVALVVRKGL